MPRLTKKASKKAKQGRMRAEMHKFKSGSLKSSSGDKVKSRAQAIAIGLSESGQSNKKKRTIGKHRKNKKVKGYE